MPVTDTEAPPMPWQPAGSAWKLTGRTNRARCSEWIDVVEPAGQGFDVSGGENRLFQAVLCFPKGKRPETFHGGDDFGRE